MAVTGDGTGLLGARDVAGARDGDNAASAVAVLRDLAGREKERGLTWNGKGGNGRRARRRRGGREKDRAQEEQHTQKSQRSLHLGSPFRSAYNFL